MKKILASLLVVFIAASSNAQIETPQPSPFSTIHQKVGLTDVTLEYSRPGMRGRSIFGDLVPFGKIWRTGANANTKITFSTDITIDGKPLKKGTYAIYSTPNEKTWDIIFYTDASNWGTPQNWDSSKVAAQISTTSISMPMKVETFTMTFDDLTNQSAVIGFLWDQTYVGLKFEVPTDTMVSKMIEKTMAGPSASDMYAAAVYYLQSGKDIQKAKNWIDIAITMTSKEPKFWYLRQQALIHAKAGNKKSAIKAATASLNYAQKAGNANYVKMNKEFIASMK